MGFCNIDGLQVIFFFFLVIELAFGCVVVK